MKRQLLFRAKPLYPEDLAGHWWDGVYVYGQPYEVLEDPSRRIKHCWEMVFTHETKGHKFLNRVKIDPNTIEQWTGLTDPNGTKIFEGDTVEFAQYTTHPHYYCENVTAKVTWHKDSAAFMVKSPRYGYHLINNNFIVVKPENP